MRAKVRQFAAPSLLLVALVTSVIVLAREGSDVLRQPLHVNLLLVLLATVLANAGQLVAGLVWCQILRAFGIYQSPREDLRVYFYSALSVAIPGSIWVMASRSAFYAGRGISPLRVAVATTLESMIAGVAAIAVYALTALILPGASLWQNPVVGFGCAALALVLIQPRVLNGLCRWALRRSGRPVEDAIVAFSVRQLLSWFVVDAVVTMLGGLVLFILLNSMVPVPLQVLVQITAAWAAAVAAGNLLFFLPGTIILRDGALVMALSSTLSLPVAILFTVLSHGWSIAALLVSAGAAFLVLDLPVRLRGSQRGDQNSAAGKDLGTDVQASPAEDLPRVP